jgi:putative transposase
MPGRWRRRLSAVAANTEGRREVIGLGIGPAEAGTFWTGFLRSLRPGPGAVWLVIGDAHTGLRGTIARGIGATWQRCRLHWLRNALAQVSRGQHRVVAALAIVVGPMADTGAFRQAFDQPQRTLAKAG